MRFAIAPLCVCALLAAGCSRGAPAVDEVAVTPDKPVAVQKPVAAITVADVPLGADENGNPVHAPALDAIKASLKDPDPSVRRMAVKAVAKVSWKAIEPSGIVLAGALADADPGVRIAAAGALLARGQHEAEVFPALAAILQDRQAGERQAVLELLRAKPAAARPATPALVALTLDAKDPLRVEAIDVLAELGNSQEAVDVLLLTAHDPDPKARAAALRALARLDPASAKVQVTLVKALRDPNADVVHAATAGVGRDGIPALIDLLRHSEERLRDASARALGRIGPDAYTAVAELTRLAQSDPAERVRQSARAALKTIQPAL